ncbi:Sensor histidine kinase ChvG [Caenispirillum salinarum AK4]|uniref:histidine kinase n=1 Tax=Caenispirillum salinarum AK4 TaxID=1238182 RepID=K9HNL6_9PROT|nr:stimulus-sensing domain-containing protein [Caenispirillum salinarum]EKV31928.1 Sensor histidine kinase ChvG [Caenispirillum salinarum AK4]
MGLVADRDDWNRDAAEDPAGGDGGASPLTGRAARRRARAQRRSQRRRRPWLSPLTRRILAVNLVAPALLAFGMLYLDQYEEALVAGELTALRTQADLIAAAVGEGAVEVRSSGSEAVPLIPMTTHRIANDPARQMVRRLADLGGMRVRLFDHNGLLVADSRLLMGAGGLVQVSDLPPVEDTDTLMGMLRKAYDWLRGSVAFRRDVQPYIERPDQTASDYDEVVGAVEVGDSGTAVRRRRDGTLVLSAATPVQHYKQVVGAVMVQKSAADVDRSVFEVRLAVLKLSAVTLAATVLLSLYLAAAIARPLTRLSQAAERVRHGKGRVLAIPDLSARKDEIGDLSQSLREMTEDLWARMDAIEAFAADVAHEIKNPLTSLRSAVETTARVKDPDQQRRLMAVILDDVQRMNRLISDISDASRLDAELSRAETEPVALGTILDTLVELHNASDTDGAPRFVLDAPKGDALVVPGLEGRLAQVFRNLMGNAAGFSPPGGTITVRARRDDGWVRVTVEDEGPGIPRGKERDIFNRFYTERPAGEKFGTHSGLGLSISKQIVEAHRGAIRAENRRDDMGAVLGARFIVTLPADADVEGGEAAE